MTTSEAQSKQALSPEVGEALLEDMSVVELMQNPKVSAAIAKLKTDPGAYSNMVASDPELGQLFLQLQGAMAQKEAEVSGSAPPQGGKSHAMLPSASDGATEVPPLLDAEATEAEHARAQGAIAFKERDYAAARVHYERAAQLQPDDHVHWSNLAVAQLRSGAAAEAVKAARECVRLHPRGAKGYLRLGEGLLATGAAREACDAFNDGLHRAEGTVRLALTKGLQQARAIEKAAKIGSDNTGVPAAVAVTKSETDAAASDVKAAVKDDAPISKAAPPQPRKAQMPPTLEEERVAASRIAALQASKREDFNKYAELAKQQTAAAAQMRLKQQHNQLQSGHQQAKQESKFDGITEHIQEMELQQAQEHPPVPNQKSGQPSRRRLLDIEMVSEDEGEDVEAEDTSLPPPVSPKLSLENDLMFDLA